MLEDVWGAQKASVGDSGALRGKDGAEMQSRNEYAQPVPNYPVSLFEVFCHLQISVCLGLSDTHDVSVLNVARV